MNRFNKIYLEISNICNLKCIFCPGTKRKKHSMTEEEFSSLLPKLRPYSDYLYFHLMGEPLCHPRLECFMKLAADAGFKSFRGAYFKYDPKKTMAQNLDEIKRGFESLECLARKTGVKACYPNHST